MERGDAVPGGVRVRPATEADAPAIARVHLQAWRETYSGLVPADALAALDLGRREASWHRILATGVTNAWVAVDDERVVGWATASPGHAAEGPRDWELE